jgi:predicted SAM-dependent methyltransferase
MLEKGDWEGFSTVKWDIAESLFQNNLFDRLVARMVFHHILDNLDRVFLRCYDLLRRGGKLIVAEGVPPSEDKKVVDWYTHMFSFKEKRRTFTPSQLEYYFKKNGFKRIKVRIHVMERFSIHNWLENSGLGQQRITKIMNLHLGAPQNIKDIYNMQITNNDCLVDTTNVIISGEK